MIEKRLCPDDVAEIMSCSRQTAIRYMRRMIHAESPLTVKESDFLAWEARRTVDPEALTPCLMRTHKGTKVVKVDDWKVPRRREAK